MEEKKVVSSFLESQGKILLLRRSKDVSTYKEKWAVVSGYIEEGLSPRQQALKEILEETGLGEEELEFIKEGKVLEIIDERLGIRWTVHPLRFRIKDPRMLRLDWEHREAKWINPHAIPKFDTVPGLKEAWERVR
jgi:ADP-ribose pyrophosphatase YjhB (NUDIX family)